MRKPSGIEEIIQQAMRAGHFDNLPGEGKPIAWDPNDYSGDDWELAHHLLKENGFAPEFIEIRKRIEKDVHQAQSEIERAKKWRITAISKGERGDWIEDQWKLAQEKLRQELDEINKRIRDYNLIIPADNFYCAPLRLSNFLSE